jgi:hypothetical protein
VDGAREVAVAREPARRAGQHRGVAVVTASVHQTVMARSMRRASRFDYLQRVHIRAQADGAVAWLRAADRTDDAQLAHPLRDVDAERAQLLRDEGRRPHLFHAEFRMGVDVTPNGGQFGLPGRDGGDDWMCHGLPPNGWRGAHDDTVLPTSGERTWRSGNAPRVGRFCFRLPNDARR